MKFFWGRFLFLILFFGPTMALAGPPEIPPAGVDKTLLNHKTSLEFFKDRGTVNCRARLAEKRAAFKREKDSIQNNAKGANEKRLVVLENRYIQARKALLAAIEECGECASNPVETQTVSINPLHHEAWYISDGSCQIQNPDPKKREAAFDHMVAHLMHLKEYPNKVGGFHQILDTRAVDPITFAVLEDVNELAKPPQNMLLWVRGLEAEKIDAYWYITKNQIDNWSTTPGLREFAFRFTSVPEIPPKSQFKLPIIRDKNIFGKPKETKPIPLSDVIGMWYLNSNGYLRYYTAANFGATSYFIKDEGREAGLNAVKQLEEKGREKIL